VSTDRYREAPGSGQRRPISPPIACVWRHHPHPLPPPSRGREYLGVGFPRLSVVPVYGWFTEGFDTADLKEAKTLLDELQ
jgi:hypothetical protein